MSSAYLLLIGVPDAEQLPGAWCPSTISTLRAARLLRPTLCLLTTSGLYSGQRALLKKAQAHASVTTIGQKHTHSNLSAVAGCQEAGLLPRMFSLRFRVVPHFITDDGTL